MSKVIFRFAMVVTSAIGSTTTTVKPDPVPFFKPELRVEKTHANDSIKPVHTACNLKIALS